MKIQIRSKLHFSVHSCLLSCHTVIMRCAKCPVICSFFRIWMREKRNFHWILITIEKLRVKWAQVDNRSHHLEQPTISFNTGEQFIHVDVFRQLSKAFYWFPAFHFLIKSILKWSIVMVTPLFNDRYPKPTLYIFEDREEIYLYLHQNTDYICTTNHIRCIGMTMFTPASILYLLEY